MEASTITLSFYLKSATPIHTYTLPAQDPRLPQVLEDVRMVKHGNYVFVHLRSEFEWERALHFLNQQEQEKARRTCPSAA
ncbi:hypothetical protein ACD591_00875 [Rufibacter glacialis]|uniref:Uncharacterized protein n=1 Tax=Rufibacter glacialis TaxID=1259555 RepID=A0A5M8QHE6_9BACT|nr:hypothetical protein [Rufibacter glacialis]KAA6435459.1 hypothetical protein FOE74_05785 [Rufibacter glacialis]GGK63618.1 hypothetical protein GCM10011405_09580 [Rufibacter glacialis]